MITFSVLSDISWDLLCLWRVLSIVRTTLQKMTAPLNHWTYYLFLTFFFFFGRVFLTLMTISEYLILCRGVKWTAGPRIKRTGPHNWSGLDYLIGGPFKSGPKWTKPVQDRSKRTGPMRIRTGPRTNLIFLLLLFTNYNTL